MGEMLLRHFMMMWTTVDPVGNLAIFAALTASLGAVDRRRVALRATIYAAVILIVAVVAGQILLDAIGIHLLSLKLAGGLILFIFAIKMLFGDMDRDSGPPEPGRDIAVFPLAVPSIAGPGTIMAVIVLTDNDVYTIPEQVLTSVMLLAVLLITYVFFLLSEKILRVIGRAGASILIRVMGIILAALSVELVMSALGIGVWAARTKH
jgi:multiple antibiotic resistance protein